MKKSYSFEANENVKNLITVTSEMDGHAKDSKGAMRWNFGTDFSARITPLEVIQRCDEMIARINRWMTNIQMLKEDAQKQFKENNAKEADAITSYLSIEDLERILDERKAAMAAANGQPAA